MGACGLLRVLLGETWKGGREGSRRRQWKKTNEFQEKSGLSLNPWALWRVKSTMELPLIGVIGVDLVTVNHWSIIVPGEYVKDKT